MSDLEQRLDFYGIDHDDWRHLPEIAGSVERHAPVALEAFYEKIRVTPDLAGHFSSNAAMDHAKSKQLAHWMALFASPVGRPHVERANRVGAVHARIGLDAKWYIGAYARLLTELIGKMARGWGRGNSRAKATATLVKLSLLDMDLALTAIFDTQERERQDVIGRVATALEQLAAGDFSVRIAPLPAHYAQIEQDFEAMRARMASTIGSFTQAAEQMTVGSREIQEASDDLAGRTQQQALSIEKTAGAMHHMTQNLATAVADTTEVQSVAQEAREAAVEGASVISEAVAAMTNISSSAEAIGEIVELIDGIAFQTNLLALNAGVEAARAGVAGKGFAVVATEVRALAQRSADAASQINSLISSSRDQVRKGVDCVGRSGDTFQSIVEKVVQLAAGVSNVAASMNQQSEDLQAINAAIDEMDRSIQQNAAMVEETTAATRNLAREAVDLNDLVLRFRVSPQEIEREALCA